MVLRLMRQNDFINDRDYQLAIAAPITVAKGAAQSVEAPYFVDLVNDALQNKFQDTDFRSNAFRVYTTLDLNLQRAAADAVRSGMEHVDAQIKKQRRFRGQKPPEAQVALIAIDPHTGEIKALVGGRNYGVSQLNHVLAKRQPGSIFKPFVYAAAMDTAVEGGSRILTPSTIVLDQPTTFWFDGKPYEPSNFEHKFYGDVTLRDALAHSLNVATVKVAEMVGYDSVVEMANRAGMNYKIQATPAVALGSYEITPLEVVGAYTIFANHGDYVKPGFLRLVRSQEGRTLLQEQGRRQTGAGSARVLPDDRPDGRGAADRHRGGRPGALQPEHAGCRQNRHLARRLVCRLHVRTPVRGLGGLRRQSRAGSRRRALGRSHLGGVHEAGRDLSRISRYEAIPGARRDRLGEHRPAVRNARPPRLVRPPARRFTSPAPSP